MSRARLPWLQALDPLAAGEVDVVPPPDLPYLDLLPERLRDAAVLVPLRPSGDGLELILTRRTDRLRHHAGQISFPGGRVEAGDPCRLDAALREAHEEIGLEPSLVRPLGCLNPVMTITGYAMVPFVGLVAEDTRIVACPHEVDEVFTVPLAYVLDDANHVRQERFYKGRMREVFLIRYEAYTIWGATAAVLVDFAARVAHDAVSALDT